MCGVVRLGVDRGLTQPVGFAVDATIIRCYQSCYLLREDGIQALLALVRTEL